MYFINHISIIKWYECLQSDITYMKIIIDEEKKFLGYPCPSPTSFMGRDNPRKQVAFQFLKFPM